MTWALAELERLVAQMIRVGTIAALELTDAAGPRCTVSSGDLTTDWLPWFAPRAGNDAEFWAPEVGEQCVVFSPFGDQAQGFVLVGIFQTAFPAPNLNPDQHTRKYKDGAIIQYDRAAHSYLVNVPAGGNIVLQCGQTTLTMTDGGTTLATPLLEVNAPQSIFDGQVVVKQLLSYLQGLAGENGNGGSAATIRGGIAVTGGDVTADGIGMKEHHHTEHDGSITSPALA